jgi:putative acetyltransferase
MIRHARAPDHAAIRAILDSAFGRSHEGDIVDHLRADGDVMFELVEEEAGVVTGHVVFSRLWADSQNLYAALGPLAVRPDLQGSGTGDRLTRVGLDTARDFGAHAVMVVGHASYYPRFGFSTEAARQISCPYSGLPAFMAVALEAGALDQPVTVAYPDAFGG